MFGPAHYMAAATVSVVAVPLAGIPFRVVMVRLLVRVKSIAGDVTSIGAAVKVYESVT